MIARSAIKERRHHALRRTLGKRAGAVSRLRAGQRHESHRMRSLALKRAVSAFDE